MITHLRIRGLAVIDSLDIEFQPNLNVITGETGAGKSILITAMNLLLGAKGSVDLLRKGCIEASITGQFNHPTESEVFQILEGLGIPFETVGKCGEVIVRRSIQASGRSQSWINDIPVSLATLKRIGVNLIDIFGQHENQKLLDSGIHWRFLDAFISNSPVKDEFLALHSDLQVEIGALKDLLLSIANSKVNRDYLTFRLEELDQFQPDLEEYNGLKSKIVSARGAAKLMTSLNAAQQLLDYSEGGAPLTSAIRDAEKELRKIESLSPSLPGFISQLKDALSAIEGVSYSLGQMQQHLDVSEEELAEIEDRLGGYADLCKKMGTPEIEQLLSAWDSLRSQIASIDDGEATIAKLVLKIKNLANQASGAASNLSKERKKAAASLTKGIERELKALCMQNARISVEFANVRHASPEIECSLLPEDLQVIWGEVCGKLAVLSERGAETVQFCLASNIGESSLALHKIASGGELSRIMLALKRALSEGQETCVLVFDEVDAGISGTVADAVGRKLRELSKKFQTICISHLPQVAAYADTHFKVAKRIKKDRTESIITALDDGESLAELARLLSGNVVSDSSLLHARTLRTSAKGEAL